jgi:hypothetical protein
MDQKAENTQEYQYCAYDPWTDQSKNYGIETLITTIFLGAFNLIMIGLAFYYWITKIKGYDSINDENIGKSDDGKSTKEQFENLDSFQINSKGSVGLDSDLRNSSGNTEPTQDSYWKQS